MRLREQLPNDENILNTYLEDKIDRNKDLFYFTGLLNDIEGGCSIALDSYWGSGKTFFVKQAKMLFEAYNDSIKDTNGVFSKAREKIKDKRKQFDNKDLKQIFCVYYDAWENDGQNDPVESIIYEIVKQLQLEYSLNETNSFDKALSILKFFSGKSIDNDVIDVKSLLANVEKQKKIEKGIDEFFESIFFTNNRKLIVFIDELDRCTPTFAVKLLERINHYFLNDSIIFVFSVNLTELQHTVKKYYGENINASRYLDRFFDLKLSLPPISEEKILQLMNISSNNCVYESICIEFLKKYNLQIREMSRYINTCKLIAYDITYNQEYDTYNFDSGALRFSLNCVAPIVLGLKIVNLDEYYSFISGNNKTPLIDILSNVESAMFISLLDICEYFGDYSENSKKCVKLENRLEDIYNALFVNDYSVNHSCKVGKLKFIKETKKSFFQIVSAISKYADVNYDKKPEESE